MNILNQLFGGSKPVDLKPVIDAGAYLVDVRTPGEFARNHVSGSVNIPLDLVASQIDKFRDKKTIVVFCGSGSRSSQAKIILKQNGFTNVVNGGSWKDVSRFVS